MDGPGCPLSGGAGAPGAASACAGCPGQAACQQGTNTGPDAGIAKVKERLGQVKFKVLILSGKGGVGKSTFTSLLGRSLASKFPEKNIGILDIDICGPSQPRVLGASGEQVHNSGSGWSPIFIEDNLSVMSIGFLINSPDDAIIWRGPKKNGLIQQFLTEVDWGQLDFLLIDTPPGTSDEHISLVTSMREANLTGGILITTPQELALLDVRKEATFCRKMKIPILGIVENMSTFVCPKCSTESEIFPRANRKEEVEATLLGSMPLDPRLARCCDTGKDPLIEMKDSPAMISLNSIVNNFLAECKFQP
ncbi:NUBP iron-sulfur cluster assembly factor 1 [Arctopsyche grandis]|uniref:NUBP iron-sulfur cluster assembly factor 1 n=1 Tax=Arctopsyche grandis TaxID=121162 RepID=UPI00406D655D